MSESISLAFQVVRPEFVQDKTLPLYDREAARKRVEMLTVRRGTCTSRWGSWGTHETQGEWKRE